ncbi:MAG: hemerythrin domain-containing protein [Candidatus Nanopelagicales bacterium]|nr:hemerythrin domain-containing protein [Candidatus Nanopelagicales bacterium]MDZ4249277.1 hemerythrin domain-containing protein [Candidatus Nanopelagicales bacterium]
MSDKPADLTTNRLMHAACKRDFVRVRSCLKEIKEGDRERACSAAARWQFVSCQLRTHQAAEDKYMWPVVRERSRKPEELVVINAMVAEHNVLAEPIASLDDEFAALAVGRIADVDAILARLDDLVVAFSGHAAHEERDATKILRKYLTEKDLREYRKFSSAHECGRLLLPWMSDGASPADQATVWRAVPFFARWFVRPIRTRRYRALSRSFAC